jgi:glutaredoxin
VRLFTRRGCHLCQSAWQLLTDRQRRFGYTLDSEDVDADPALLQWYGNWVPVVTINGKLRFRGGVSPILFDRLFKHDADGDA